MPRKQNHLDLLHTIPVCHKYSARIEGVAFTYQFEYLETKSDHEFGNSEALLRFRRVLAEKFLTGKKVELYNLFYKSFLVRIDLEYRTVCIVKNAGL